MVSPISLEPIFGLKIQLRPATHDRANANLRTKKNSYSNFDVITKYVGLQMCQLCSFIVCKLCETKDCVANVLDLLSQCLLSNYNEILEIYNNLGKLLFAPMPYGGGAYGHRPPPSSSPSPPQRIFRLQLQNSCFNMHEAT